MWQTQYDSSPNVKFTFNYSIIGNFNISHITHINYHHPTYLAEHGLIKRINDSLQLNIFYKYNGDDHDLY
jgi:hypothetical protein